MEIRGIGASPGRRAGRVYILRDHASVPGGTRAVLADCILAFAGAFTPKRVLDARACIGMVARNGGFTCHAASIARELGIPCVVGLGDSFDRLKDGQMATIDGLAGLIEIEE